jgi:glucose 1-dehydrogenase
MPLCVLQLPIPTAQFKENKGKNMQQRFQGELAIVTGADSGIGQATAIALGQEGADVVITYFKDKEGAADTVRQIAAGGRKALALQLDQRDPGAVRNFFQEVRDKLGLPTVLVNNAGKNGLGKFVKDLSDEEWDDCIRTNLHGPFYCCREFIRMLDGSGRQGAIVNVTSVHQEIPMPGAAEYDSSKGGLRNLTTTLALEVAQSGIRVNNLAPGMILTPMNQEAMDDADVRKKKEQAIPMRRAGTPEEMAQAILFLASKQASYVHGATLVADGALVLMQGQGA